MASTSGYQHHTDGPLSGSFSAYLNRQVLYVKDIDINCPKEELEAMLQPLCPPHLGTIKVPLHFQTGNILGYAYLNYWTVEDAAMVLEAWRFKLFVNDRPVKMLYAMVAREALDLIFGPAGQSHNVFVYNISPEVDAAALFERFRLHGEVFTCEVNVNQYKQPYGIVHYMEEASVPIACQAEDHSFFYNTIIKVTPHHSFTGNMLPAKPINAPLVLQSSTDFPSLGAAQITSARSSQAGNEPDGHLNGQHLATIFAPAYSQQDEQEQPGSTSNGGARQHAASTGGLQQPVVAESTGRSAMHPIFDRLVQHRGRAANAAPVTSSNAAAPASHAAGMTVPVPMPVAAPQATAPPANVTIKVAALAVSATSIAPGSDEGDMKPGKQTSKGSAVGVAGSQKQSVKELVRETLSQLERLSDMLCCPITQEPFKDPVVAADGHSYERSAIEGWLQKSPISPMTNVKMAHKNLLPNTLIKHLCEEFS